MQTSRNRQMINAFLTYMRCELSYSAHTVLSYGTDLRQFAAFITGGVPDRFDPISITPADIRSWILSLADAKISHRSIHRKVSALSSLFNYMMRHHGMQSNPAAEITLAKVPKNLPVFVRPQEMEEILGPPKDTEERLPKAFIPLRNHLIVLMLYTTGIRRGELIGMLDCNVDTQRRELKVLGKRNKERLIPFGEELATTIDTYRRIRTTATGVRTPEHGLLTPQATHGIAGCKTCAHRPHTRLTPLPPYIAALLCHRHAQQRCRSPRSTAAIRPQVTGDHTGLHTYNLPRTETELSTCASTRTKKSRRIKLWM